LFVKLVLFRYCMGPNFKHNSDCCQVSRNFNLGHMADTGQLTTAQPDIIERRRLRRERKQARREAAFKAMGADAAIKQVISILHRKELELQTGEKTTRKERSAILKSLKASVSAAASVGMRVRSGQAVPDDMLATAAQYEPGLIVELIAAIPHNASGVIQVASCLSDEAHHQVKQAIMDSEKSPAVLSPVTTEATLSQSLPVEQTSSYVPAKRVIHRYTEDIGVDICQWIQSGKSLNAWCKQSGIDAASVYRWLGGKEEWSLSFSQNYARAHMDRADTFAEDMVDISNKAENASNMTQLLAFKLQIETRQWIASRMKPEKWGDKLQVEQKGQVVFNIALPKRGGNRDVIDVEPVDNKAIATTSATK
jgi:hypothetical protein